MLLTKRSAASGNENGSLEIDYSRAPCLGADQKARGLWERDWCTYTKTNFPQAKLVSEINVRFLLNEHGDLYFLLHNNSVHIVKRKLKKIIEDIEIGERVKI